MLFDRAFYCENCGTIPKAQDKKWCQRCVDRYRRKGKFSLAKLAATIPLEYLEADVGDFPAIEKSLADWNMQDNLFFYGDCGTGKTRAMYALFAECCKAGYSTEAVEFNSVCSQIRETYNGNSKESEDGIVKRLSEIDVLFLDDLGLQSGISEFAYLTFYRILDKRLSQVVSTVISSNKEIDNVADIFDRRIASRLNTFQVIEFTGEDFRAKAAQAGSLRTATDGRAGKG